MTIGYADELELILKMNEHVDSDGSLLKVTHLLDELNNINVAVAVAGNGPGNGKSVPCEHSKLCVESALYH